MTKDLAGLIAPVLGDLGFALVRVRLTGRQRRTLQVMAERADGEPVTVGDCARISRALSPVLDVADPIDGGYTLEVSSTGVDRPLVTRADFERFAGQPAELRTAEPIDGRRRFRGRLGGLDGDAIVVTLEGDDPMRIPLGAIAEARLAVSDTLKPCRQAHR